MSLELKIEALTAAVTALTAQLQAGNVAAPAPVAPTPAPVVQAAPAPVAAPVVEAPVAAAPTMPAPPTFVTPAPAPAPTGAPFSDPKGLIDYVMGAYKALGPQKGAMIQGVLTGLGYQNINDVKPEHYAALHTGVEGLK
ncbi:hypothetical protein UFOVP372_13 [uncultured Caudovirales phage]|uniref:Uncharacterized protein n=1 Tax=uncultured Caudovirales phage TaxID=2100421 RepID=A0A6J7X2L0_9CAUD|nr:hypothetical protein UFOVP372_13 [uncultured Caudovirales phage]